MEPQGKNAVKLGYGGFPEGQIQAAGWLVAFYVTEMDWKATCDPYCTLLISKWLKKRLLPGLSSLAVEDPR